MMEFSLICIRIKNKKKKECSENDQETNIVLIMEDESDLNEIIASDMELSNDDLEDTNHMHPNGSVSLLDLVTNDLEASDTSEYDGDNDSIASQDITKMTNKDEEIKAEETCLEVKKEVSERKASVGG